LPRNGVGVDPVGSFKPRPDVAALLPRAPHPPGARYARTSSAAPFIKYS